MAFKAYVWTLEAVTSFKYMGRVMNTSDNNWPAVVKNMRDGRRKWSRFSRLWGQEGANARTSDTLYKAVVQATFLFG